MEEPNTPPQALGPRSTLLAGGALVAFVLAVHIRALGGAFLWDDREIALGWPQELARRGELWTGPFTEQGGYYRPLISASYLLDGWLFGQDAAGFHLTNLLAHAVVTLLVMALGRRLGASVLSAAACAALWAVLPRLTESVTWVSGRTDVFMAAFSLGGLLLWPRAESSPAWGRRALSLALLACSLGSKETGLAGILAVLTLEWTGPSPPARRVGSTLALMTLAGAFWALRTRILAGFDVDVHVGGALDRARVAADALGSATLALVDPLHPSAILGTPGDVRMPRVALGALAMLGLGALGVAAARSRRGDLLAVWVLGTAALLAPLPWLPNPVNTSYADRFLYLPTAAAMASVATLRGRWPKPAFGRALLRPGALLAGLAFAVLAWQTNARITHYQDPARFWTETVVDTEGKRTIALRNLGAALQERLELGDAELVYRAALALHARGSDAFLDTMPLERDLTNVLALRGKADAALSARVLLATRDGRPSTWLEAARSALTARRFDQAEWALAQPGVQLLPLAPALGRTLAALREGAHRQLWERGEASPGLREDAQLAELHERVQLAELLAWRTLAVDSWLRIARHPAASSSEVTQACAVLCQIGSLDALRAALTQLGTAFPESPGLPALRTCERERSSLHREALALRQRWAPLVPHAGEERPRR